METSNEMFMLFTAALGCAFLFAYPVPASSQSVQSFSNLYEPSGAAFLSDGRVVVVEDEGDQPLRLFSPVVKDGALVLSPEPFQYRLPEVDDLEDVVVGKNDELFLITSHSKTKSGKRKKVREQLITFPMHAGQKGNVASYGNLIPSLQARLKDSLGLKGKQLEGINIEGLAFNSTKDVLLIGLRSPAYKGKAILLSIRNPYDLKRSKVDPIVDDDIILLDLEGATIRAITYDKKSTRYLIAGEAENKKGKLRSRIWAWDGLSTSRPNRLKIPITKEVKNIEGLTIVQYEGASFLLFVCDDGNKKENEGGNYGFIDIEKL